MVEDVKPAALAAGAPGVKVLPDNFIERHAEGYEWRGDSGDYTPKEHEVAMLIDFGHSLLSELPADPRLQTMRAALKEARGVFKCLMASGEHKDAIASGVMASIDAALSALDPAPSALVAEPGEPVALAYTNWRGEHDVRRITPKRVWFGATEWHPEPQWLLTAFDHDKQAERDFALTGFAAPPARQDGALREALDLDAAVSAAAIVWCGEKDRETFQGDVDYFKCNWRALGGLTAYVDREIGKRVRAALAQSAAPVQLEDK